MGLGRGDGYREGVGVLGEGEEEGCLEKAVEAVGFEGESLVYVWWGGQLLQRCFD